MGRDNHPIDIGANAKEEGLHDLEHLETLPLPPPSRPTGEAAVKKEMIGLLTSEYTFSPSAAKVAKSIRDYAMTALTTAALTEHTSITLEDDPV